MLWPEFQLRQTTSIDIPQLERDKIFLFGWTKRFFATWIPINDSTLIIKPPYFTSFEQKAGKCGMNLASEIVCLTCVKVFWKGIVKLPLYLLTFCISRHLLLLSLYMFLHTRKWKNFFLAIGEKWSNTLWDSSYVPKSENFLINTMLWSLG